MMNNLNYVRWIQENKITLFCENKEKENFLREIGAKRKFFNKKIWIIECKNESILANMLQLLNERGFMFAGGSYGWNPIDIFISMRGKKIISGKVTEIVWSGENKILTRIL